MNSIVENSNKNKYFFESENGSNLKQQSKNHSLSYNDIDIGNRYTIKNIILYSMTKDTSTSDEISYRNT